MAGVYCARCQTKTLLEQDGRTCSNCGTTLVLSAPTKPTPKTVDNPGDAA